MRVPDGKPVVGNDPYAETKSNLAVSIKNLDEAIEFAGKLPVARRSVVEIRPLREASPNAFFK